MKIFDDPNIPVIDLFAGPGGLGEGFSTYSKNNENKFRIKLSIEVDNYAHQTLELRSFFRQFKNGAPKEYYDFLRNQLSRPDLFNKFPIEACNAKAEAWRTKLGVEDEKKIDEKITAALKGRKDWVLIGGPPCQAYSIAGRVRNKLKNGLNEKDERVYLYREYYRILAVHNPPVFIMENVKGLLSSKLNENPFINVILDDLRDPVKAFAKLKRQNFQNLACPGYNLYSLTKKIKASEMNNPQFNPADFIIRTEKYGIPQSRHRLIILGIRKDISSEPPGILEKKKLIPLSKVLLGLQCLRSGLSKEFDSTENWLSSLRSITRKESLQLIDNKTQKILLKTLRTISEIVKDRGGEFINNEPKIEYKKQWFLDHKIKGTVNHSSRSHLTKDLYRYLFATCFAKAHNRSPRLSEFPIALLPNHKNVAGGDFNDRFRVQCLDQPSKTITSHIAKDGHYYIHPDPTQCRSFTVREAARIQTFPDNYFFCGPRTFQYQQVGNAVPPLLANQIAKIVFNILKK